LQLLNVGLHHASAEPAQNTGHALDHLNSLKCTKRNSDTSVEGEIRNQWLLLFALKTEYTIDQCEDKGDCSTIRPSPVNTTRSAATMMSWWEIAIVSGCRMQHRKKPASEIRSRYLKLKRSSTRKLKL
jgi:hypothetical protein